MIKVTLYGVTYTFNNSLRFEDLLIENADDQMQASHTETGIEIVPGEDQE